MANLTEDLYLYFEEPRVYREGSIVVRMNTLPMGGWKYGYPRGHRYGLAAYEVTRSRKHGWLVLKKAWQINHGLRGSDFAIGREGLDGRRARCWEPWAEISPHNMPVARLLRRERKRRLELRAAAGA